MIDKEKIYEQPLNNFSLRKADLVWLMLTKVCFLVSFCVPNRDDILQDTNPVLHKTVSHSNKKICYKTFEGKGTEVSLN